MRPEPSSARPFVYGRLLMRAGNKKPERLDIKMFVTDVDGVLTDGGIYVDQEGRRSRRFCVHDGMAFEMIHSIGLRTALVSGKNSPEVLARAEELGISDCLLGKNDKRSALEALAVKHNILLAEICYMGDDLNDLAALELAGYAVTVPDAPREVKAASDYVCEKAGGAGAFREAVDHVLRKMGRYATALEKLTGSAGV
jgi:3-deoxy-D-manno-octulosonate 8-phosphate phosphatase (KDO 8-P phosphatase)